MDKQRHNTMKNREKLIGRMRGFQSALNLHIAFGKKFTMSAANAMRTKAWKKLASAVVAALVVVIGTSAPECASSGPVIDWCSALPDSIVPPEVLNLMNRI